MDREPLVYVGTVGEGLWRSGDGGRNWERLRNGLLSECEVRALAFHPRDPATLYAGTNEGAFVSIDAGQAWRRPDGPLNGLTIWSLATSTAAPRSLLAGTRPAGVYRSDDDGETWRLLPAPVDPFSTNPALRYNRVTLVRFDPIERRRMWVGVEIGGVLTSGDDGETWETRNEGLSSLDIHGLAIVPTAAGRRLLASTNNDLNLSDDEGRHWTPQQIGKTFPWSYCRGLAQQAGNSEVLFLGNGDGPPGSVGAAWRSPDGGRAWQRMDLPGVVNSTVWDFATNPADPERVYAYSVSGQVFLSRNHGDDWEKLPREFGEIRSLGWVPAPASD